VLAGNSRCGVGVVGEGASQQTPPRPMHRRMLALAATRMPTRKPQFIGLSKAVVALLPEVAEARV
jgi:hypothetical protein